MVFPLLLFTCRSIHGFTQEVALVGPFGRPCSKTASGAARESISNMPLDEEESRYVRACIFNTMPVYWKMSMSNVSKNLFIYLLDKSFPLRKINKNKKIDRKKQLLLLYWSSSISLVGNVLWRLPPYIPYIRNEGTRCMQKVAAPPNGTFGWYGK